jgi:RNA polymerase sigma factor (sigma-70 family)
MSLEAADEADAEQAGLFEPRRLAFIESIADLRPRMHRYCARMTGSALDSEDVMQEAIFEAYLKLGSFDAARALGPWLFRIAHNRCIDFLRRRHARLEAEVGVEPLAWVDPPEAAGKAIDRAIERLVIALPPKERACVLLKDVFDYSLEDIPDLVESTTGGVKAGKCNCSSCTKARSWLAVAPASRFRLVEGEASQTEYQWTPPGRATPSVQFHFCKRCGIRIPGRGEIEAMGAPFTPFRCRCLTTLIPTNSPPHRSALSTVATTASIDRRTTCASCKRNSAEPPEGRNGGTPDVIPKVITVDRSEPSRAIRWRGLFWVGR